MAAVIFDLDGTLIHSAPDIHAGVNAMLAAEGLAPMTLAQVTGFIGNGVPVLVARVMAAAGLPPDEGRRAAMEARFMAAYHQGTDMLTAPYPGVVTALDGLAARGLTLGICTNKPEGPARLILQALGLQAHFAVVVGGDTLPRRKPDPLPLLHTLAALGGGPAIYVGDSEVDAETAAAAGLRFALFTGGYRKTAVADITHHWAFDDFAQLTAIVDRM